MKLVEGEFELHVRRVFDNLRAVCREAGGDFDRVVRVTVYLTDLANFTKVNEVMASYFNEPYPARAAVGVASLPRGSQVEIDAIMFLGSREEALAPLTAAEAVPLGTTK
jgi:reactive intermediate/imine deaminase